MSEIGNRATGEPWHPCPLPSNRTKSTRRPAIPREALAIRGIRTPCSLVHLVRPARPSAAPEGGTAAGRHGKRFWRDSDSGRVRGREGNDGRRVGGFSPLLSASPLSSFGSPLSWAASPLPAFGSALSSFNSPLSYRGFPSLRSVPPKRGKYRNKRRETPPKRGRERVDGRRRGLAGLASQQRISSAGDDHARGGEPCRTLRGGLGSRAGLR